MNIKKHIPNILTTLNLVCGTFAVLFFILSSGNSATHLFALRTTEIIGNGPSYLEIGIYLVLIATILDFLDGFAARLLKVQSEIGAQLDSLADLITFGLAPGFLFYSMAMRYFPLDFWVSVLFIFIPAFSALRLAKFNVDKEQTTYFKGLATPANALFWIGVPSIPFWEYFNETNSIIIFVAFVVSMSLLMVSNLRMFSLKLKNLKLEGDNIYRVILIIGAVILTITFGLFTNILAAIPFIILLYILLSIQYHYTTRKTQ